MEQAVWSLKLKFGEGKIIFSDYVSIIRDKRNMGMNYIYN